MLSTVKPSPRQVDYLPLEWTDHRLLSLDFRLLTKSDNTSSATANGRGFWKAHPHIAVKTARAHSRRQTFSLARAESLLQRKRAEIESNLINNPSLHPCLSPQLHIALEQLTSLQQYHVETLSLKAGTRWREQGELSAGYLKRTASARLTKTTIPPLFHPTLDRVCVSKDEMLDAAFVFYDNLFAPINSEGSKSTFYSPELTP
ncbi:hypothetical protein A0J61_10979 [Choanephora cucurbitarum]|uniref:Uncharacterized protein n=1 Tax=Choanephora cucurbitarum TaxID=101091 RepID=A0A1C7MVZ8_9FUNG|nr:hypothetical protein A0J61_10979 [Choanephora cucurbitarum]